MKKYFRPIFDIMNNYIYKITGFKIINQKYRDKFSKLNVFEKIFSQYNKSDNFIFFDVGANKGQSTDFFKIILNKNEIVNTKMHLFEPDLDLANSLKTKFKDNSIKINQIALSNITERKKLFQYKNNEKNSFYKLIPRNAGDAYVGVTECNTQKLDDYCKINNIGKIHFLKIDCEGEEINVLDGSRAMITNDSIDYIYIETSLGETYENKYSTIGDIENKLCNNFELLAIENHSDGVNFKVQVKKRLTISLIYKKKKIKTPDIYIENT